MQMRQTGVANQIQSIFKHTFRFRRKPRDKVGAEDGIGADGANFFT